MRRWTANGVPGLGPEPALAGSCRGTLLVCGSGRCLWDDLARAPAAPTAGDVMAVNFAGLWLANPVRHWASIHGELLVPLVGIRRRMHPDHGHIFTHAPKPADGVDHVWETIPVGHASGFFACLVGLALGYDRLLLAGIPADETGHFYDPPGTAGGFVDSCAAELWRPAAANIFRGRVRSMSGRTRDWLGGPD